MLEIKVQGSKEDGWCYSPKEGQSQVLEIIKTTLPQLVLEDKPAAVWWKVFRKTQKEELIKVLKENELYINDQQLLEQNALAEEILQEILDEEENMESPIF